MKKSYVVIGMGRFGSSVAERLYELGNEGLAAMCDRTLKMRDGRIIDQTTNNQQCDDCQ